MSEPTNNERATRIDAVLEAYARIPDEADLRDLLADIMHYCDREKIDFDAELSQATDNYAFEKEEPAKIAAKHDEKIAVLTRFHSFLANLSEK